MFKIGDAVKLSAEGRRMTHLFHDPNIGGRVVKPGPSRGGLRVRILVDGETKPRTFAAKFWRVK